jgi:hypothetical protein
LGKNTTAGSPRISERGLDEGRTSFQELEVNTMEEGWGRVLMDNAKVKNKAVRLQEKQDLNCKMRN